MSSSPSAAVRTGVRSATSRLATAHGPRDHDPHVRDRRRVASVQAPAGIVADSVPAREFEETENKMRALLTASGRVRAAARGS